MTSKKVSYVNKRIPRVIYCSCCHKPECLKQSSFELIVVQLVNLEREKEGLKPLLVNAKLAEIARKKALDMIKNKYFSHKSPIYGSPFQMMKAHGITYQFAGENIASGYTRPETVVNAWMNSPGHRTNIMKPEYTYIGVGYCYVSNGFRHYWVQEFIRKWENGYQQRSTGVTTINKKTREMQSVYKKTAGVFTNKPSES